MDEILDKYNMLHKRLHLNNICSAALDFLGFVVFDPEERGLDHRYPVWSFSFVEGNDGVFFFEDRCIIVPSGKGIFIPPYQKHYLICRGPNKMKLLYFGFSGDNINGQSDVTNFNEMINKYFYVHTLNDTIKQIVQDVNETRNINTLYAHSGVILENILKIFNISNAPEGHRNSGNYEKKKLIHEVKNIIARDLSKNLSLSHIAPQLYISERYLAKLFVDVTGMSFKSYCLMIKMEQASRLLYTTNKNIMEISDELGFCDIYYFSKRFKEYFNCSPGQLRKSIKLKS